MAKESIRTKVPARRTRSSQKPVMELVARREDIERLTANREDIERRAFEIYVARGASEGNALGDWVQAERELMSMQ